MSPRTFVLLLAALSTPAASAGGSIDVGPVAVGVEDDFGDGCGHPPVGCFFSYGDGDTAALGDDRVDLHQRIRQVRIALRLPAPIANLAAPNESRVEVSMEGVAFEQPLVRAYDESIAHIQPASAPVRVEANETGLFVLLPIDARDPNSPGPRWETFPFTHDGFLNYTHVVLPNEFAHGDSDGAVGLAPHIACASSLTLVAHGVCRLLEVEAAAALVVEATPTVRIGADVYAVEAVVTNDSGAATAAAVSSSLRHLPQHAHHAPTAAFAWRPAPENDHSPPFSWEAFRRPIPLSREDVADTITIRPSVSTRSDPPISSALIAGAAASALALALLALLYRGRVRRRGAARLLEDATRQRIVELVTEQPGLSASAIGRELGLANSPTLYHVRLLAEEGALVVARRAGARSRLHVYPPGGAPPRATRQAALDLSAPAARDVARALLDRPEGALVADVADAAGLAVSGARFHLNRLREHAGVVDLSRRAHGTLVFRLTKRGRELVCEQLGAVEPSDASLASEDPARTADAPRGDRARSIDSASRSENRSFPAGTY